MEDNMKRLAAALEEAVGLACLIKDIIGRDVTAKSKSSNVEDTILARLAEKNLDQVLDLATKARSLL